MKDEKKYITPRELGLFVGQSCKYNAPHGVLDASIAVFELGLGIMVAIDEEAFRAEAKNVKPVLRSLESMTEDEARKFLAMEANPSLIKPNYKGDIMPPLDAVNMWYLHTPRLMCTPEGFLWLIGHGFDVFGWVKMGLAIEKEL